MSPAGRSQGLVCAQVLWFVNGTTLPPLALSNIPPGILPSSPAEAYSHAALPPRGAVGAAGWGLRFNQGPWKASGPSAHLATAYCAWLGLPW